MINEKELIVAAKNGDIDAFETLFEKYRPIVYKLFKAYYIQGYDFDDWLQEGQIVCFHSLNAYDSTKGFSFGVFFKMNFKRHVISIIRHQNALKRRLDVSSVSLEATLSEKGEHCLIQEHNYRISSLDYVHIRESLKDFIELLSRFERAVFKLYVEGLSTKEIAASLSCPISRVNNALDRIKKKLKGHLY
ncbi:sigma-70 family RNA polymerase sigma factor [Vagococcus zengguangii]|uniref:RNA polymerase sigma factor SigS n=1 Tax=Vagococcus zengguangii TaxID=2571750 RepID=A0A4D7CUP6_9ENTE|nr:sigma-70 family RNA polymerase sigma factor [Vagococcus zengguangii]QCI87103.1 sigma-70 family RNA polymerase sigma factor [Vagococcus zengguangii]TLG80859.1 sigma-70 family RNA polymerase sigma factor [Vagococcus zengguangii]